MIQIIMMTKLQSLTSLFEVPKTPGSYFISFEGIEGCGKSTQIQQITSFLMKKGFRVLHLREPGGTSFGEQLRQAILTSSAPLHPLAECHLFLASRAQLLMEKILPFLQVPQSVVVVDRFLDSTLAYQGKARGLGYETILSLHQFYPLNLVPHRTYFLDIDVEISYQRQNARGPHRDYFESEKIYFYKNLIEGYRELEKIFPKRILKINAQNAKEVVTSEIEKDLEQLIS